jgi:hypothetical protein
VSCAKDITYAKNTTASATSVSDVSAMNKSICNSFEGIILKAFLVARWGKLGMEKGLVQQQGILSRIKVGSIFWIRW